MNPFCFKMYYSKKQNKIIMKNLITLLLSLLMCSSTIITAQNDTLRINRKITMDQSILQPDCAHGHICCQVGCYCCPEEKKTLGSTIHPRTNYPKGDGLTYNQYVGENIAGYNLADGWRKDSINGGFNKEIYTNPYVEGISFDKQNAYQLNAYKYVDGKKYTGRVEDTFTVRFTPDEIKGYLNGKPYYESVDIKVIFRGDCVDGMMQGHGILAAEINGFGMYNNLKLSECTFENGEIVGTIKSYDLNAVKVAYSNGEIHNRESTRDYFEFITMLNLTEIEYEKGSMKWIQRTTYQGNDDTGKVISRKKNKS